MENKNRKSDEIEFIIDDFETMKESVEIKPPPKSNLWIAYAIASAIGFGLTNSSLSSITLVVGPACFFYFSSGSIVAGVVHHLYRSFFKLSGKGCVLEQSKHHSKWKT